MRTDGDELFNRFTNPIGRSKRPGSMAWGYEDSRSSIELGVMSKQTIIDGLKRQGVRVSDYARDLLNSREFTITESREEMELVARTVADLGLKDGATTAEIFGTPDDVDENGNPAPYTSGAMTKYGLEFCPPEVGPLLRMRSDTEIRLGTFLVIAMEPITGSDGDPFVFYLERYDGGPWLGAHDAGSGRRWSADAPFVFRLRKEPSNT